MLPFVCCESRKAAKDYGFKCRHFLRITPHTARTIPDANSHGASAKSTNSVTSNGQHNDFTPSMKCFVMSRFLELRARLGLVFDIYTTEYSRGIWKRSTAGLASWESIFPQEVVNLECWVALLISTMYVTMYLFDALISDVANIS